MTEPDAGASVVEVEARQALAEGRHDTFTNVVLRGYGKEILSFISAMQRQDDDAAEVFAQFAEGVWRSAAQFREQSSVRTWAYAIARRASLHHRRDKKRREKRFVAFAEHPALAELEAAVRTDTLSYLRTERMTKLAELRASLPEQERELLILRIDRRLAWQDLARVLAEDGELDTDVELKKRAARLRKQFQALKERLRTAAKHRGLLDQDEREVRR